MRIQRIIFLLVLSIGLFLVLTSCAPGQPFAGKAVDIGKLTDEDIISVYRSGFGKSLGPCSSDDDCRAGGRCLKSIRDPQDNYCVECVSNSHCPSDKPVCKPAGSLPPSSVCVTCYGSMIGCNQETEYCKESRGRAGVVESQCLQKKAIGEKCTLSVECQTHNCDLTSRKCVELKAVGEKCSSSVQCQTNFCDLTSRKCAELKAVGGACISSLQCQTGYCAIDNKCAEKKALGESCRYPTDCQTNYCDSISKKCAEKKAVGEMCKYPVECQTNRCDKKTKKCS